MVLAAEVVEDDIDHQARGDAGGKHGDDAEEDACAVRCFLFVVARTRGVLRLLWEGEGGGIAEEVLRGCEGARARGGVCGCGCKQRHDVERGWGGGTRTC